FGDRLALGAGARRLELDPELLDRPVQEGIRRGGALLRAMAVEGPAEDRLGAAVTIGLQALQPLVDERRLARPAPGDQREDVGLRSSPGLVQALQLRFATDEALVAGLRQVRDVDAQLPSRRADRWQCHSLQRG